MPRILMVVSASDHLTLADGTSHPTGFWAEEVAASHQVLTAGGATVDIATPGGRPAAVDPISLNESGGVSPADAARWSAYLETLSTALEHPLDLSAVELADYDGIHIPGGHAPMTDLATDADLGRLLLGAVHTSTPVAALCHGVAALLPAVIDGRWAFAGKRITGFTDQEERQGGYGDNIPWSVEDRLRRMGAILANGEPWSDTVVVDGTLVTGQNPQSSASTATALLELLG